MTLCECCELEEGTRTFGRDFSILGEECFNEFSKKYPKLLRTYGSEVIIK